MEFDVSRTNFRVFVKFEVKKLITKNERPLRDKDIVKLSLNGEKLKIKSMRENSFLEKKLCIKESLRKVFYTISVLTFWGVYIYV